MAKAVIFDRDGVILDSESANVISAKVAFGKLGIKINGKETDLIVGRPPEEYLKSFIGLYDFSSEKFMQEQSGIYHELIGKAEFFKETIKLVNLLHEQKFPIALTTSSSISSTMRIIHNAGLDEKFDAIVAFGDYNRRKPDPEPYLVTAERLKLNPKRCVVIEDSQVGLQAAKSAGMKCIVLPNEYTRHLDFSVADKVVNSANDITLKLLKLI